MESSGKSPAWLFLKRQQEAIEWIEKVTNHHFEHEDNPSKCLGDGVYLCRLMLWIEPRSIPKYHEKPNTPIKNKENIFLFIEACRDYGVAKEKLFIESDLSEQKNIVKVIDCIEALEKLAVSKGFAIPIERIPEDHVDYAPEDVKAAEAMIQKAQSNQKDAVSGSTSVATRQIVLKLQSKGFTPEDINKRVTKIQAIVRSRRARRELKKRKRAQAFRDNVAKEILHTEETYVSGLQSLITYFKKPLQELAGTKKEVLGVDHIKSIFSDVEIILGYNTALLAELKPRVHNWSPSTCLGDIFLKITRFMKVYTNYVNGYDEALQTLAECKKAKEKLVKFLASREDIEECPTSNIEMLLILPIQRIPRYNLLLEQLMKHTWDTHRDYKQLVEAYNVMKDVANYINEKKREFENVAKVREIQNALVGKADNLISPNRKFVRSDVVAVWSGTNDTDKKQQELVVTLFNDLIVVAQAGSKKGTLKFKEAIRITNIKLKEPKMRKWASKRATLSGVSKTSSITPDRERRMSNAVDPRERSGSFVLKQGSLGPAPFSVKFTAELVNSRDETILKVCFDNPVGYATWLADFKKIKQEIDEIDAQRTERAKKVSEATKLNIAANLTKSLESRKSQYRSKSLTSEDQAKIQELANEHAKEAQK